MGLSYNEGYGLTETASFLHGNPLSRGKRQCLGMPTQACRVAHRGPETLEDLPLGEVGELVTHGPQVMQGYWRNARGQPRRFFERDGKRFSAPAIWPASTKTAITSCATASNA